MKKSPLAGWLGFALLLAATPVAHAQFAVIDVASLGQLVSQLQTLEQQVSTARSQLGQAQAEFQSMTGGRGMEQLLAGTTRNYLPRDWPTLQGTLQGGSAFVALGADVRSALREGSMLTDAELVALPPAAVAQLQSRRQSAALLQGLTHQALANSSERFAALQQLIGAIAQAGDQKAALDLQARIAAESGMLQNENTKLQVLYRGVQADEQASDQRARELIIAGHGQFGGRFQPRP